MTTWSKLSAEYLQLGTRLREATATPERQDVRKGGLKLVCPVVSESENCKVLKLGGLGFQEGCTP